MKESGFLQKQEGENGTISLGRHIKPSLDLSVSLCVPLLSWRAAVYVLADFHSSVECMKLISMPASPSSYWFNKKLLIELIKSPSSL